jgi:AraC family transcriptional regulator of adaptative response / DNA-3-methyladenine glycosylase II
LLGTALPITEVAFASGFSSIRRFNAAYRDRQRMAPSEVRRGGAASGARAEELRVVLDVRPPFDPRSARKKRLLIIVPVKSQPMMQRFF